jgi:ABC-type transport system involved in multi-copper enzyme maturation permease subunit
MTPILFLAANTVRELMRNKLLYLLIVFSVLLILGSLLLTQLTIGQWERIINDVSLATIQLAGVLVAIMVGVGLIAGEIDKRTVYVTLSKPLARASFVLGKYLGLCATMLLIVVVMGLALSGVLLVIGAQASKVTFEALALIYVELCVLAAFATLFSSFTTQTLGVIYTTCIFIIGHLATDLAAFGERATGALGSVVRLISQVIPNLDLLNLKTFAANALAVDPGFVLKAALYGLAYSAGVVLLSTIIFTRKDFK